MSPEEYCKMLYEYCGSPSGVIIKHRNCPVYISSLCSISNHQSEIILICKEGKPITTSKPVSAVAEIEDVTDSIADLSVTGQPLECPFDKDETLNITYTEEPVVFHEDHYHGPLSMQEARRIIGIINLKLNPPAPVYILTDMKERGKMFLLGSGVEDGWRTSMWSVAHSNQIERVPIKVMLEDFEKNFKIGSGWKVTSSVCCVFNIKDQPGMAKNAKCLLEARWQKPSYEVPITQADTSLIIECNVGNEESQISRWWRQLNLLHEYIEIIKQLKQSKQVQVTYQRDGIKLPSFKAEEGSKLPLLARVRDLIQRSDSMSVCRQLASSLNVTSALNSTIHELLTDKQKGQDFTDRLWSLLIEAETYQELAESFQVVLNEVRKNAIKPYIFAKNRTRLASLLRNIKTSSSDMELMLEPLELMVEMGLEKLKRDYMFMFLASHITSEDSLCIPKLPSFVEVGASEWQDTVGTWLRWLAQLHAVLELVSVIHTTMSTPILVQVTGLALTKFLSTTSPVQSLLHLINNRVYEIRAPVISKEVKTFIEGSRPFYKWALNLTATVADKHLISSTYVLLENSPLPEEVMLQLMDDDDSLDNTAKLTESMLQESCIDSSKFQEKYCYLQMCSDGFMMPY